MTMDAFFLVYAGAILISFVALLIYTLYHFVMTWIDNCRADDRWSTEKNHDPEILVYGKDGKPRFSDFQ
jgi:hypothetical protein